MSMPQSISNREARRGLTDPAANLRNLDNVVLTISTQAQRDRHPDSPLPTKLSASSPFCAISREGLGWRKEPQHDEVLATEVQGFDTFAGGVPRGRITEIVGGASSGRTTLLHRLLAQAGSNGEYCAVVDTANSFDPESATMAGVRLDTLVWVKCSGNVEHAFKTADMLIHSGGFGVVALDLCEAAAQATQRIPLSYWHRFRRAVEDTPTMLVVLGREANAKSCASLLVEAKRARSGFTGSFPAKLLQNAEFEVTARKPYRPVPGRMSAIGVQAASASV